MGGKIGVFWCLVGLLIMFPGGNGLNAKGHSEQDFFRPHFPEQAGCFVVREIGSDSSVKHSYGDLCAVSLPPMSTFKIALAAMAFESGFFKSTDDILLWDGKAHTRKAENKDQTPKSFIANSVIWVSRRIIDYLGSEKTEQFLVKFGYGNKQLKGDPHRFWLTAGSLKVTAIQQLNFLEKLWTGELGISDNARKNTLDAILYRKKSSYKVFGKTGTGCIDLGCMQKASRQLGWFVGIVDAGEKKYTIALVTKDSLPQKSYGGPRARKLVMKYLELHFNSKR